MRLIIPLFSFLILFSCVRNDQTTLIQDGTYVNDQYSYITIDSNKITLGHSNERFVLSGKMNTNNFVSDGQSRICNPPHSSCVLHLNFFQSKNGDITLSTPDTLVYSFFKKKGPLHFSQPEKVRYFQNWDTVRIQKMGGLEFDILQEDMVIASDGKVILKSVIIPNTKGRILTGTIDIETMGMIDHYVKCMHPEKFEIFHGEVADARTRLIISLKSGEQEYLFAGFFFPSYFDPWWNFIVRDYRLLDYE